MYFPEPIERRLEGGFTTAAPLTAPAASIHAIWWTCIRSLFTGLIAAAMLVSTLLEVETTQDASTPPVKAATWAGLIYASRLGECAATVHTSSSGFLLHQVVMSPLRFQRIQHLALVTNICADTNITRVGHCHGLLVWLYTRDKGVTWRAATVHTSSSGFLLHQVLVASLVQKREQRTNGQAHIVRPPCLEECVITRTCSWTAAGNKKRSIGMAQSNVSSCVLSIVASFASGLDVFKKFRQLRGKRRKTRKNASLDDEEVRLAKSLRQGPEDIGREYQRSLISVGEHFAQGDGERILNTSAAIAQTSLAEILLQLNIGLVTVINAFLGREKHDTKLDCQSLTSLSEKSRVDTIPRAVQSTSEGRNAHSTSVLSTERRSRRKPAASPKRTTARGPILARVVIADSNKPGEIAMVRPGERKKKRSSSRPSSNAQSCNSLALPGPLSTPPPQYTAVEPLTRPQHRRANTHPEKRLPQRNLSSMDVSTMQEQSRPDALRATRSTPRLERITQEYPDPVPAIPAKVPMPNITSMEPRRRLQKPTPTLCSIASDSTKLGEIPLHKWSEPVDFDAMSLVNKEAVQNGWPVMDDDLAEQKKKRGGLLRLFRRNRSAVSLPAFNLIDLAVVELISNLFCEAT
ncbi:uncharacterized protein MYCFIDRAFT_179437 [Pseudocercospora fijiensis CIRAD86]|uniref:Uncharacterized protein n=1 Tax=Pseudocercospora fijiensis (strain CIRAD86) TaxID=383855 RepID=M3A0Q1_PSEFD|nr:uncharacterized protein MYCFIDRAFT_179437 [Pseudocercospora fijiensis CIRAD86]EME77986.1 hypothetical protein MYCFIDRAFT_179437 [Pseudocercospora fijiensis CIRAD86]